MAAAWRGELVHRRRGDPAEGVGGEGLLDVEIEEGDDGLVVRPPYAHARIVLAQAQPAPAPQDPVGKTRR
jgi:hypothetical protein